MIDERLNDEYQMAASTLAWACLGWVRGVTEK